MSKSDRQPKKTATHAYLRCKYDQQATEDGHEIEEQIHGVPNKVIVSALSLQDDKLSVEQNESAEEKQTAIQLNLKTDYNSQKHLYRLAMRTEEHAHTMMATLDSRKMPKMDKNNRRLRPENRGPICQQDHRQTNSISKVVLLLCNGEGVYYYYRQETSKLFSQTAAMLA